MIEPGPAEMSRTETHTLKNAKKSSAYVREKKRKRREKETNEIGKRDNRAGSRKRSKRNVKTQDEAVTFEDQQHPKKERTPREWESRLNIGLGLWRRFEATCVVT